MKVDRIQREGDSLVVVIRDVNEKSIQE